MGSTRRAGKVSGKSEILLDVLLIDTPPVHRLRLLRIHFRHRPAMSANKLSLDDVALLVATAVFATYDQGIIDLFFHDISIF